MREALLDAAEIVIDRDGFGALRARGLTATVGCALGALYTVFSDMDALVLAMKLRILDQLDDRVAASLAGVACPTPDIAAPLAMAEAYLTFAWVERRRWEVLFQHYMADGTELPEWYRTRLGGIFARIAAPLRLLLPALSEAAALRLAQSLFAAIHGVVVLGLEGKLGDMPRHEIAAQIEMLVRAAIAGIGHQPALAEVAQPGGPAGAEKAPGC